MTSLFRSSHPPYKQPLDFLYLVVVPLIATLLVGLYLYAHFSVWPYLGFELDPDKERGLVQAIYASNPDADPLREGDIITSINGIPWKQFYDNLIYPGPLVPPVQTGDKFTFTVDREGEFLEINWIVPANRQPDFIARLQMAWWIPLVFLLSGFLLVLFVRPIDIGWRLLNLTTFANSIWISAGFLSGLNVFHGGELSRSVLWLAFPLSIHLYWYFPHPLGKIGKWIWGLYLVTGIFALSEWFFLLGLEIYLVSVVLSFLGVISLLVIRLRSDPVSRRDTLIIITFLVVSLTPPLLYGLSGIFQARPPLYAIPLISLVGIPLAHLYVIAKPQLGKLEIRANRLAGLFIYGVLIGSILIIVLFLYTKYPVALPASQRLIYMFIFGLAMSYIGLTTFEPFQNFIDRRLLGVKFTQRKLLFDYSDRITSSLERAQLLKLIETELLPSLLIRQSLLLTTSHNSGWEVMFTKKIDPDRRPGVAEIPALIRYSGQYISPYTRSLLPENLAWIRVVIPISIGDKLQGLWLLGRRDPDDFYSQDEITTLSTIANQTGIALLNINQSDYLRQLYRENINRHETERQLMALELHDEILNEIASLQMQISNKASLGEIHTSYQALSDRIRQMIQELRPALLNYGLSIALDELCDQLQVKTGDSPEVSYRIENSNFRYDPNIELHIYRIVQQACENSIRHAGGSRLEICGNLDENEIQIEISDDGVGFSVQKYNDFSWLLANRHYGMVGMHERASIIGAQLVLTSSPGSGTQVRLRWRVNNDALSLPAGISISSGSDDSF